MPSLILAVVEIGDDPMLLLVAGIFVLTFVSVCAMYPQCTTLGDAEKRWVESTVATCVREADLEQA